MAKTTVEPFVDTLAAEVNLDSDQKEILSFAHGWVQKYNQCLKPDAILPTPVGTRYEAWALLKMVLILSGYSTFPMPEVQKAVHTPPDFVKRVGALLQLLELNQE